jgi:hypothetical protein
LFGSSFAQTGDYIDRVLYGFLRAQIEVRCLTMSERPSSTLCSIIRRFPVRVAQELAQVFELGSSHSRLNPLELRHSLIGAFGPPGFISNFGFRWSSPLVAFIGPESIPIYKEGAHNL